MNAQKYIKEVIRQRKYGADLVVSFHINSSTSSIARGSEVYVTQNTRVDRFFKNSDTLAVNILDNLYNIGIPRNGKFSAKLRPTESGNLYPDGTYADYYGIIRYPMNYGIPSVLIEHCFISNAADREFINNDTQIDKIAQADAQAIIANKELFRIDKTKNAVKAALDSIYYDSNTGSIRGTVLYNEVINDMTVDTIPKISLVSEDGIEKIEGVITKTKSYTYSYDINIMNINPYKEYFLQVETNDKNTIPQNNLIILEIPDGRLGTIYGMEIDCANKGITFNAPLYDGFLNSYPYTEISTNGNKIEGKIVAQEWIDGVKQIQPRVTPKVFLVAEDVTEVQCDVSYVEPYVYIFSCQGQDIDITQNYSIKVEAGSEKNISSRREMILQYKDGTIGLLGKYMAKIRNNQLVFDYDGYMTNAPYSDITLNGSKISGKLVVQEWVGEKYNIQVEPSSVPKIVVKDIWGRIVAETILEYSERYVYGYEIDIATLEIGEYTIEIQGTDVKNISDHQNVEVNYPNQEIGNIENATIKVENGKLIKSEKNNDYDGYMLSYPFIPNITLNENKISGELVVQEWLNGTKQIEPATLPKLVIKDDSNTEIIQTELKCIQPYLYSYELDISSLEIGEYTVEVQGTNPNNISNHQNLEIEYKDQKIGNISNNIIKIENGKLTKEEKSNKYDGYMLSYPFTQNITVNGNKISGKLVVQEWLNGTKQIEPTTLPKLVIKDSSNIEIVQTTLKYVDKYLYSYELDISDLQTGNYTFEIQGTNPNNISNHQNLEIYYEDQELVKNDDYTLRFENRELVKMYYGDEQLNVKIDELQEQNHNHP